MSDNSLPSYDSMAAFYASTGGRMEQEFEFTIHPLEEIHADVPVKSPLFRANYYSVVLVQSGHSRYFIDSYSYDTRANTVYFTNPGHIKGFELPVVCTGWVITFAESFLTQFVHERVFEQFPFLIAEIAPPSFPEPEVFAQFDGLAGSLSAEFQSTSPNKPHILGSYLQILLYKIKEHFWQSYDPLQEADSGSLIVSRFKQDLSAHYRALLAGEVDFQYQVQDYAARQQLHPNYLSTVIRTKTGKTMQTWIAERTVAEAKALLMRSQWTVQEVAYRLAFKEPGHFSRYFKKHTGFTPTGFRKSL